MNNLSNTSLSRPSTSKKKKNEEYKLPLQENADLEEYIEILKNFEISSVKDGRYIEAEMAKNRVLEIKKQGEKLQREELKVQQIDEKNKIEQSSTEEFNEFNKLWDKKIEDFNLEAKTIENNLREKQEEFLKSFEQELSNSMALRPKESAESLNLRKIEEQLANQKEYIEAHKVQQKRMQLEKIENEKWEFEKKQKISKQIDQLKIKQKQEMQALLQKIESGQDEQRKTRAIELEKLLQKYQNIKKELDNQHQNDLLRLEKTIKNPSSVSVSKFYGSRYLNKSNDRFFLKESLKNSD